MTEQKSCRVSVITVCRNNLEGLKRTYHSVVDQWANDMEWLVVDGNSTDGTKRWLAACDYDKLRYVSEPSNGVFDAMNKGVRLAKGTWVIFLGAGDVFCDKHILRKLITQLKEYYEIVAGDTVYFSRYGTRVCRAKPLDTVKQGMPFYLQSVLVQRALLLRHSFVARFDLAADYEFFYWAVDQHPVDLVMTYPITVVDGRDQGLEEVAIERERQYRQIQGRYRGFWNQLSWIGFVARQRLTRALCWLLPRKVRVDRRTKFYTTNH